VSNEWQSGAGIYFIQTAFIMFAVGTPIGQLLVLLALWFQPFPSLLNLEHLEHLELLENLEILKS